MKSQRFGVVSVISCLGHELINVESAKLVDVWLKNICTYTKFLYILIVLIILKILFADDDHFVIA